MPNIIPKKYVGKYIGVQGGGDQLYEITAAGAQPTTIENIRAKRGEITTVLPEELAYLQNQPTGRLSSSLNAFGYPSYEEQIGTAAARAQYGEKFRDRPGLEAGVYTPEPYKEPVETFAMRFRKQTGRLPTREEMIKAGEPVAQSETPSAAPSDMSKFYTDIPFRAGLSETQKQSIQNLIKTGRVFNETDAKNYAYAIGQSNWKQYVGKTSNQITGAPGAGTTGGAGGTPLATDPTSGGTTTETISEDAYQKALDMYSKGYTAPEFDKVAKRKELASQAGLDKKLSTINEMDVKIDSLEAVIRNREDELRSILKSRNATEADIKRELANQLRPLQRELTDLYTRRNVESETYNRAMARVETDLGDLETANNQATAKAKEDFERRLKGYGIQIDRSASLAKAKTTRAKELMDAALKIPKGQTYTMADGTVIKGLKEPTTKSTSIPLFVPTTPPKTVPTFEEFIAEKRKIQSIADPEKWRDEYAAEIKLRQDIIKQTAGQTVKGKQAGTQWLDQLITASPNATFEELFVAASAVTNLSSEEIKSLLRARKKNPTPKPKAGSTSTNEMTNDEFLKLLESEE